MASSSPTESTNPSPRKRRFRYVFIYGALLIIVAIGLVPVAQHIFRLGLAAAVAFAWKDHDKPDSSPKSDLVNHVVTPDNLASIATENARLFSSRESLIGAILWYARDSDAKRTKLNGHLVYTDCSLPPARSFDELTPEERRQRYLSLDKYVTSQFSELHAALVREAIIRDGSQVLAVHITEHRNEHRGPEFYVRYSDTACTRYFEPIESQEILDIVKKVGVPIQKLPRWGTWDSNKFAGFRLNVIHPDHAAITDTLFLF